jgi:hypothetical protein
MSMSLKLSPQRREGAKIRKGKSKDQALSFALPLRPLRLRAFAVKDWF